MYKLTITPMNRDLPHLNCLFCIEGKNFYLINYMEGTKENRNKWEVILNALNNEQKPN